MKSLLKFAVVIALFGGTGAFLAAQTSTAAAAHKPKKNAAPSIETQIQQMRQELQSQIDDLKTRLAAKDAQIEALQNTTQVTENKTATITTQVQAADLASQRNTAAMEGIRSSIDGLHAEDTNLVTRVEQVRKTTDEVKKSLDEPAALHYKGITIVPAAFLLPKVSGDSAR